ncbi:DNA-directed RNA polymerases I, II, and III 14.4 kDa polypeptide [Histomonas meleagridis]|uniref:DNA-directed RNA polymerases I II and III 14.4 kDa polypeptide n=1 Tax=Histomonas meleagridis TaxID=135588 RepID=UPI0035596265|nr:DNA-directed RNA polymerases I, II, and III 14.4 kDa polypeptide [Histomonas meleagridis]KAH0805373.1 DNA-directed RNA polymerases I II and III 14.4 kDa polypeptide [Histomonas meleagridis]
MLSGNYQDENDPQDGSRNQNLYPHRTTAYLTKYEKARVLGTRALQISQGAPVDPDVEGDLKDPLLIAEVELRKKLTPLIIRRYLPDGTYEDVAVRNLLTFEKST